MTFRIRLLAVVAAVALSAGAVGIAASASPAFADDAAVSGIFNSDYGSGATLTVGDGDPVFMTTSANFTPSTGEEVSYAVFSDPYCTDQVDATGPFGVTADEPIPASDTAEHSFEFSPGTYYGEVIYTFPGDVPYTIYSDCGDGGSVLTVIPLESSGPDLSITKVGSPTTVTAGNAVKYTVTVADAEDDATGVVVDDTLPAGTTFLSATPTQGSCAPPASGHVLCSLGALSTEATASIAVVLRTASAVPSGGMITNAVSVSSDSEDANSDDNTASASTTIVAPTAGQASGFVPPGGSITTGGTNPATLSLPNSGPGAAVTLTQGTGNFCAGPCVGPATTVSSFPGYTDPHSPISLVLGYAEPSLVRSLVDFLTATIYYQPDNQTTGIKIRDCADNPTWTTKQKQAAAIRRTLRVGTQSGIANPAPCVDARSVVVLPHNQWRVNFTILYLSGDPRFAKH